MFYIQWVGILLDSPQKMPLEKINFILKNGRKKISSALEQELQVAILKKAVIFEKEYNKGKKKFKRQAVN